MAEVVFSNAALTVNGGAVTFGVTEPEVLDGWTPVLPSKPVIADGGTSIAPDAAKGVPVSNNSHSVIHSHPADGRKVVPGHLAGDREVRITSVSHR